MLPELILPAYQSSPEHHSVCRMDALSTCVIHCMPSALQGGGVQVNNARVTSEDHQLTQQDLIEGRLLLLAAGKKNKLLVTVR